MFDRPSPDHGISVNETQVFARIKYRPDGRYDYEHLGSQNSAAVIALKDACQVFLDSNLNLVSDDLAFARRNCQTFGNSSAILQRPPDIADVAESKVGMPFENFHQRKTAGEIMMSDYERSYIKVVQTPGMIATRLRFYRVNLSGKALVDFGILTKFPTVNGVSWRIGTTEFLMTLGQYPDNYVGFSYTRAEVENPSWVYPPAVKASWIISRLREHKPEFTGLITRVTAKANRSSVDVLTAFAELPKSVISLLSGFRLVAKILRDAKKGEVDLSRAHARKEKIYTDRFKKRLARLDRELSSPNLNDKRRAALTAHRNRVIVTHRETLAGMSIELANALSNVWLNYRYNIMPNVYLAQDVVDAVTKFGRQWITAGDTEGSSFSIDLGFSRIDVSQTLRCKVKRSFSQSSADQAGTVISNDIFVTAWELVPLSFVYDWFINVGDFLSAQSYSRKWEQEGATVSWKIDLDSSIPIADNHIYVVEPRTVVRGYYYKRNKINPTDHCGLVWQPTMGLERYLDLIALSWRPVRSLLLKKGQ